MMLHIATATIAVIFVIIREVYNQIIQFLDYDSHHRVPADIEERISEHLYRHKTEYFPGLCQGLTHGTVMPKTIRWNKGWQFAVVILLSKSEIKNIQTFRFRPCKEDDKPTDPNKPFTPSKKSFNNHMVAKLEQNILKRVADNKNQPPNNAMAMHQRAANDHDEQFKAEQIDLDIVDPPPYTDGAVEEADPDRYITPPVIRLATRPEQLRLSYMDELAPLTTEDYRQAPPPPKVNRRPVVTYTEIGLVHN